MRQTDKIFAEACMKARKEATGNIQGMEFVVNVAKTGPRARDIQVSSINPPLGVEKWIATPISVIAEHAAVKHARTLSRTISLVKIMAKKSLAFDDIIGLDSYEMVVKIQAFMHVRGDVAYFTVRAPMDPPSKNVALDVISKSMAIVDLLGDTNPADLALRVRSYNRENGCYEIGGNVYRHVKGAIDKRSPNGDVLVHAR